MRRYPISGVPTRETFEEGVRVGLGYADNPRQFQVGFDNTPKNTLLLIQIQYRADAQEKTEEMASGRARVAYGRYSKRLFSVILDCGHVSGNPPAFDKESMQRVLRDLQDALATLQTKNPAIGPRLNYKAVSAGLGLGTGSPPGWLAEITSPA